MEQILEQVLHLGGVRVDADVLEGQGHVSPEAAAGGPIALVEEGDIIELDVEARRLEITGVKGEHKTPEEMDAILAERKANWKGFTSKYTHGLLKLYSQHAVSAMKGAYME